MAQWLVATNLDLGARRQKGKTGFELSRGQLFLRVMRSAGKTLQQLSCDKQDREKLEKLVIVS